MKSYTVKFDVEGNTQFPIDMMRYDRCTPHNESDSWAINRTVDAPDGKVRVTMQSTGRPGHWRPTDGRWASFCWQVVPGSVEWVLE